MDENKNIEQQVKEVLEKCEPDNTVRGFLEYTNELRSKGILKEDQLDLREVHKSRDFSFVFERTSRNSILDKV